jgi:CBS domain-containing protein
MKLSDLLVDDWVLSSTEGGDLADLLAPLLTRARPDEDQEALRSRARDLAAGAIGEVARLDGDVVVVVDTLESLQGRGARLGALIAPSGIQTPVPDGAEARMVVLVLTPGRPSAARQQLVPALGRALKGAGGARHLMTRPAPARRKALHELLAVEFRPRLLVEDATVPVQYRVYPSTPFNEVVDLMVRREVHAVPVVGEGYEVLGMVTTGDALEDVLRRGRPGHGEQGSRREVGALTARDFMKRSVLCVSEDQALVDAATMMVNRDVEQLPVVRDGELVGFVTRQSILRALHRNLEPEHDEEGESESQP